MRGKIVLVSAFFLIAGVAWLQVLPPRGKPLSELIPAGALLSIEAKDFGAQLNGWNRSQVKAKWLLSQNYAEFAQSNLFKKMNVVFNEYAEASGFAPGLPQVLEIAGIESALALYDPHDLQFLYITKLTNARLAQSKLWALRDKFEARESAGKTFYLRGTGARTVAFAASGDYLFLATRDDLVAKSLALQGDAKAPRLADERWYVNATKASSAAGDLRMVLNLADLVKNTYFRSYWIQRNVAELKPFTAEICDLDRKGAEFIERRVLIRDADSHPLIPSEDSRIALQQLVGAAPQDAGMYRAWASPDPQQLAGLIEQKLLLPRVDAQRERRYAPQAPDEGNAGSEADLETRIDQPPLPIETGNSTATLLLYLLASAKAQAAIVIQSSETTNGSTFIATPSVIGISAESDWDLGRVRETLSSALSSHVSTGNLGLQWIATGQSTFKIDGLKTLLVASHGRTLYIADSATLLSAVLASRSPTAASTTESYAASFRHGRERPAYLSLMRALDSASVSTTQFGYTSPNQPAFFSSDIGSLDEVISEIRAVDVSEQQLPDRVQQIVHYF